LLPPISTIFHQGFGWLEQIEKKCSRFEQAGRLRYVPQPSRLPWENGHTFFKNAIAGELAKDVRQSFRKSRT
jgi:hypothetical protein